MNEWFEERKENYEFFDIIVTVAWVSVRLLNITIVIETIHIMDIHINNTKNTDNNIKITRLWPNRMSPIVKKLREKKY